MDQRLRMRRSGNEQYAKESIVRVVLGWDERYRSAARRRLTLRRAARTSRNPKP